MAELMDHVQTLADQIGPRPVSTEEERQASLYIAQELTDLGLEVDVDEFETPTGVRWPYVVAFAFSVVGTLVSELGMFVEALAMPARIVGLVLVVLGLLVFYTERFNRPLLSRRRSGGVSQNVVARYVPSSVARERHRRKVIIAAHVDTVRAEPQANPSIIKHYPLLRTILYYVMIALAAIYIVRLLPLPLPDTVGLALWIVSLVACLFPLGALVAIVASRFMPYVAGGNDNASSAAVMLSVAKRLLDPSERERYAREQYSASEAASEVPVETLAPQHTGSFAPVGAGAAETADFIVHDEAQAYEAGVVPEGASIEYVDASVGYEPQDVSDTPLPADPYAVQQEAAAPAGYVPQQPDPFPTAAAEPAPYEPAAYEPAAAGTGYAALPHEVPEGASGAGAVAYAHAEQEPVSLHDRAFGQDAAAARAASGEVDVLGSTVSMDPVSEGAYIQPDSAQPVQPDRGLDAIPVLEQAPAEVPDQGSSVSAAQQEVAAREQVPAEPSAQQQPVQLSADGEYHEGDAVAAWRARRAAAKAAEAAAAEEAAARAAAEAERAAAEETKRASVPSWYSAARKKAAESAEKKEDADGEDADAAAGRFRSRFADVRPAGARSSSRQVAGGQAAAEQGGEAATTRDEAAGSRAQARTTTGAAGAEAAQRARSRADSAAQGAAEAAQRAAAGAVSSAAVAAARTESAFKIDISDEDLEALDLTDASPTHYPVGDAAVQDTPVARSLTSRIPSIGSSVSDDAVHGSDGVHRREAATRPKPESRKPTARRVDESFQPTRNTDAREEAALSRSRQAAPVSSTYEATPQSAPQQNAYGARVQEQQPVQTAVQPQQQPAQQQPAQYVAQRQDPAVQVASASSPARSGVMPRAAAGAGAASGAAVRSGNTSSFPALTGSFPALTGSIPKVSGSDFTEPAAQDPFVPEPDSFAAPDPAMTGAIDIPDSRFHNAVEQATGFFSRIGRKKKDEDYVDTAWGEQDDDLGWKGGGYFDDDGAGDAARRRAAEIRDSVISMTESDLLDKEVWFVALGASNAGNQGMKNFLDLHSGELRGSLIINLEAVGAGEICYVDEEGSGKPIRSDRRLQTLIRKASKDVVGREMKGKSLAWRNTDATPAMLSGLRALSIMGFDGVAPQGWHWSTDTSAIVEEDNLDHVARVLMKVIENS